MKESQRKVINRLICSKNWKCYLLWELENSTVVWKLFAMTTEVEPTYYRYAQSLRSIDENDKADQIMEKFDKMSGNDSRERAFAKKTIWMPLRLILEGIK
jgi:hypothetical protein